MTIDRRQFLLGAAALPLVFRAPTPSCHEHETESDIEGPFYKPGAPFRPRLAGASAKGLRLVVSGRVLGTDCRPIPGAILDVWQADAAGAYDHVGFELRGKL